MSKLPEWNVCPDILSNHLYTSAPACPLPLASRFQAFSAADLRSPHLIIKPEALGRGESCRAGLLGGCPGRPAQCNLQGFAILVPLQLCALCRALVCGGRLCALYLRLQQLPLPLLTFLRARKGCSGNLLLGNREACAQGFKSSARATASPGYNVQLLT